MPHLPAVHKATFRCMLAAALALSTAEASHAAFDVSMWNLLTFTQDRSEDIPVTSSDVVKLVQNPLTHISDTMVWPNTNLTQLDFSWLLDTGSFHIDILHHVETFRVNTNSQGHLLITPDIDLNMIVDGSLTYSSVPSDLARIQFDFQVRDPTDPFGTIFDVELEGGSAFLEPASGTLAFSDQLVLPAGTMWRIDYRVVADNLVELDPDGPIDTSGFIHFAFTPVPEPATLTLLIFGSPLLLKRRQPHN